jgi:hypothetical protein
MVSLDRRHLPDDAAGSSLRMVSVSRDWAESQC